MDIEFESYRAVYGKCDRQGKFFVTDSKEKLEDYDGTSMDLFKGTYTMVDDVRTNCLIKKFPTDPSKLRLYSRLRKIRHHNVLSVQSFYDVSRQPRFVFSWADGSTIAWLKAGGGGAGKMVKSSMRGRRPSPKFREIIIDICSGLEHLFQEKIYPIKIGAENILTCKIGNNHLTKLLVDEAEEPERVNEDIHKMKLWADVKSLMKTTFTDCANTTTDIDPIASKFFDAIGNLSSEKLAKYPDNWTIRQKAKYLLKIMSMDKDKVGAAVQDVGIHWPKTSKGLLNSPLREMIAYDKMREFPSKYITSYPYDFLRICKDVIKHWLVLPDSVKDACTDWERLVEKMDTWNPEIWCILYDIFG
ncbi:unnamed protein product [Urochloa decumbens]|uniref:Uncharacterized protein n=1 Tax=Urochloa decumbens TaxID=240449 RepID=A0ABC9EH36_9POAL